MAPEAHLNQDEGGAPAPWFFKGEKGRLLYAQRWEPELVLPGPPRPPVVLVHGFGEHIGRYDNLGRALAASGWSLWAFDIAGFGRSDGPRAQVHNVDDVLADIGRLVATAAGQSLKPVLLGHSMGGAFAAAYALAHPAALNALVLSAPAVHLSSRPRWQVLPVEALSVLAPRAGLGRIPPAKLSRDPDVVAQYVADPLVWHGGVPACTVMAMYKAGRTVMKGAADLAVPLLVLHGESDAIVPAGASRELIGAAGAADKQLRVFKGLLHEVFQEVGKQEVVATLVEWLGRRRH